jgi:hypothetical protein
MYVLIIARVLRQGMTAIVTQAAAGMTSLMYLQAVITPLPDNESPAVVASSARATMFGLAHSIVVTVHWYTSHMTKAQA